MKPRKTILFLGDGMADEPLEALGGRTPLEAAATPAMDRIARTGRCGRLYTLPAGFPSSSDVANMSVLGCDLSREYCGRGPLEAAGRGLLLAPGDIAFRVNLVSLDAAGVLRDFAGGHPSQADADAQVDALNEVLPAPGMRLHAGVSYRCLLILSGPAFSDQVEADKPDDCQGERVADHLPRAANARAAHTADCLRDWMTAARARLERHPVNRSARARGVRAANGVWPWSGGRAGAMQSLQARRGIRGAVISAVDVINGLGRCLGMTVVPVAGATGYIDTHYEGKADAALAALDAHDLVYLHVEAMDEVSHNQDLELKLRAIEDFDRRLVARVARAVPPGTTLAVLPDHPVPVRLGKHTRAPVPFAVAGPGIEPDAVQRYSETDCRAGAFGLLAGGAFMDVLYPPLIP